MSAEERVRFALQHFPGTHMLTSSFGAQAAVSLHLLTVAVPDIPVVLLDTGYLFPETYQFIEELSDRLDLNLHIYRSELSPAWQEARYGRRWEQGVEGIERYNLDNKVEPMRRAMGDLQVGTWFSGIRRSQSATRIDTPFVREVDGVYKVSPIADWSDRDVYAYLRKHELPYHPLWHEGYVSIGDVHTTARLADVENVEQTRFHGLKRECGLHEIGG
jgi:phosphoadenosine phosphosulfate reductase